MKKRQNSCIEKTEKLYKEIATKQKQKLAQNDVF